MKSIFLIVLAAFTLISCGDDDLLFDEITNAPGGDSDASGPPNEDIDNAIVGTYTITLFNKDEVNRTPEFSDFTFTYASNGSVNAQNDILSEPGSWTYILNDDDAIVEFLRLNFNGESFVEELERTWVIDNVIDETIRLRGFENSGDNTEDFLTFTKQ